MKKLFTLLCFIFCVTFTYTQNDILTIQPTNYVSDYANIIDDNQELKMNDYLKSIEDSNTVQFFVLTIKSTENYDISDYSQKIFTQWGVGQKETNNGILFIVAVDDRNCFIKSGYGVEDILPDAKCSNICRENFNPYAKTGDYTGGTWKVIKTVDKVIKGKYETTVSEPIKINWNGFIGVILIIVLIIVIILIIINVIKNKKEKIEIEKEIKHIFSDVNNVMRIDFNKYEKEMLKSFIDDINDNILLLFIDDDNIKYTKDFLNWVKNGHDSLMVSIDEYYIAEKKLKWFKQTSKDITNTFEKIESIIQGLHLKEKILTNENIKLEPYDIKVEYFSNLLIEMGKYYDEKNYNKFNEKHTIYENKFIELTNILKDYSETISEIQKCKEIIKDSDKSIKECIFNIVKFSDKKHSYYKKEIKEKHEKIIDEINSSYDNWKKLLKLNQYDAITMVDKLKVILKIGEDFISDYKKKIKKKEDKKRRESSYKSSSPSYGGYSSSSHSSGGGSIFTGGGGGRSGGSGGGSRW